MGGEIQQSRGREPLYSRLHPDWRAPQLTECLMEGAEDTGHMTSGQFYAGPVTGDTAPGDGREDSRHDTTWDTGPRGDRVGTRQHFVNNTPYINGFDNIGRSRYNVFEIIKLNHNQEREFVNQFNVRKGDMSKTQWLGEHGSCHKSHFRS